MRTSNEAATSIKLSATLLERLAEVMMAVLRFDKAADRQLSEYFRAHPQLGQNERSLIAETVYAGLRHKRMLDLVLEEMHPGGKQSPYAHARRFALATLLRARHMNTRELQDAVRREELEELPKYKAALRGDLPLAVQCEWPDWIVERLQAQMQPEELLALARAMQQPAPLDLRVNLLKTDRTQAQQALGEQGIDSEPTPYSPTGLRLKDKPALQRNPLFLDGSIEVQDEGSQLLAYLLAPRRGEMVADFCAGAGGKSLAIAALMRSTGRLYAFDVAEKRLAKLKPRLARSGASNVDTRHIESERDPKLGRLATKLDRVLVDAPCSGLGTLRRNPDLKWRQEEKDVTELRRKQSAILRAAAKLVKPGGRLLYATCSVLAEENEQIVHAFLAEHPEFVIRPAAEILLAQKIDVPQWGPADGFFRLMPHVHGTDGFFAAVLDKASD